MIRQTLDAFRLFLSLFQDVPPMPRKTLIPGAFLLVAYPLLSVLLGPGEEGQAFVTSFLLALAVRISLRFETMVRQLIEQFDRREAAIMAMVAALAPLLLLASVDDPLWCQRTQSAFYIVFGSMFVSDLLAQRNDMAARFWPWPEMRPHLPTMTRAMILFNLALLVLNETMLVAVHPSQWLLFWAVLPVIAHVLLSALILTVINTDDDRDAVA